MHSWALMLTYPGRRSYLLIYYSVPRMMMPQLCSRSGRVMSDDNISLPACCSTQDTHKGNGDVAQ